MYNNFYNQNPIEKGYLLDSKQATDTFLSKETFLFKIKDNEFIKKLENEISNYHGYCKRKEK